MPAQHRDRLVDRGALGVAEFGEVTFDPVDEPPDAGDLLLGRGGVGACPVVDAVNGGGQPFPGAQEVVQVCLQVGQVGDVGAEVVAAGAPLTELVVMFPQFRACFTAGR